MALVEVVLYGVTQGTNKRGMAFRFALPPLPAGVHTLQAFMVNPSGAFKQELNQSPLKFAEVRFE